MEPKDIKVQSRTEAQADRFLDILRSHIILAGGAIGEKKLAEMPVRDLLTMVIPNGIVLSVSSRKVLSDAAVDLLDR